MRRVSYLGVVVLSLAVCWAAWGQDPGPGIGELPPPSPDLPISAGQPATHPFAAMSGQAAASRVLFEGAGPNNTEIVIREMLIGPGADVRLDALRGPALVTSVTPPQISSISRPMTRSTIPEDFG
jgi:hypothetical protein